MKKDLSEKILNNVFNYKFDSKNLNKTVKAVILRFENREVIVENDNFGTNRKYMDFTKGKIKVGLHPMQICFSGIECAKIFGDEYINQDGVRVKF